MASSWCPSARGRAILAAAWVGYGLLAFWCVQGFPPPVDVPAHGAQLQTLVELLRGNAEVARWYRVEFPLGYGLVSWLFLPLAWLTSGAVAIRGALFVALLLFPLSVMALAWAFRR